jgi:hypothetical protein
MPKPQRYFQLWNLNGLFGGEEIRSKFKSTNNKFEHRNYSPHKRKLTISTRRPMHKTVTLTPAGDLSASYNADLQSRSSRKLGNILINCTSSSDDGNGSIADQDDDGNGSAVDQDISKFS